MHRIHAGLGHNPAQDRHAGDLALFCAACPQDGVNIPPADKRDTGHPYVVRKWD